MYPNLIIFGYLFAGKYKFAVGIGSNHNSLCCLQNLLAFRGTKNLFKVYNLYSLKLAALDYKLNILVSNIKCTLICDKLFHKIRLEDKVCCSNIERETCIFLCIFNLLCESNNSTCHANEEACWRQAIPWRRTVPSI